MNTKRLPVLRTFGHSGAEHVAADIERVFGVELSIDLEPPTPDNIGPEIIVVRDPIDVMWDRYLATGQGEGTFDEFLLGPDAPLDKWALHIAGILDHRTTTPVLKYEMYLADPGLQLRRIATILGRRLPPDATIPEPSGTAVVSEVSAVEHWSNESLLLLRNLADELLFAVGYDQLRGRRNPRRNRRRLVRYVARADTSGYAVAGRRCVEALVAAGLDVVWEPEPAMPALRRDRPAPWAPAGLAGRYEPWQLADVTILHTMPDKWRDLRGRLGDSTYIGHTVWELDRMPKVWEEDLTHVDRIWVPTEWNRRTFLEGGVIRPVDVLPHAVTNLRADTPPIELPSGVTVFTTVSTWHPRKRPDWTIEAFARAFTSADPVVLVVKTPATTEGWPAENDMQRMTWWQLMQVLRRHSDPPQVMLVNDHWTDEQINGLIVRSDCYVALPASEGWGLGVFDAATFGVPLITTGYGGPLEYLGADHPGLVPHGWTEIGETHDSAYLEPDMVWAHPDLDAAAAMMRSVLDRGNPIVAAAPTLAERLRTAYSPEAVGAIAVRLLEQLT